VVGLDKRTLATVFPQQGSHIGNVLIADDVRELRRDL